MTDLEKMIKDYEFGLCSRTGKPQTELKQWQRSLILHLLPEARKAVQKVFWNKCDLHFGSRFEDDECVLKRIESLDYEEFKNLPIGIVICDALYNCAKWDCEIKEECEREEECEDD